MEKKEFKLDLNLGLICFTIRINLPVFKRRKSTKITVDTEDFVLYVDSLLNETMYEVEKLKEKIYRTKETEDMKDEIEINKGQDRDEIQIIEEQYRDEIREITDEYFKYKHLCDMKDQEITELKDFIEVISEENLELKGELFNLKKE